MTRGQQRLAAYLAHIAEAIERIDRYTEGMDEVAFLNNQLVQDAVIRNFEIIGEASNNIEKHCPEFAAAHPELPLSFAYQMRNAVRTATSRSTLKSSGGRFTATFRGCTGKCTSLLIRRATAIAGALHERHCEVHRSGYLDRTPLSRGRSDR